jgi:hypothetical protein
MTEKSIDIQTLIKYSRYLDAIRYKGSVSKRLYPIVLFRLVIPFFRLLLPLLRLLFRESAKIPTDILVLGTCERDIVGSSHIWDQLNEKGYKVERTYIRKKIDFFRFAIYCKPLSRIPSSLYLQACAARYFTEHYQPKMLATFYSYDVLPSFLKAEMNGKGPLVYIAHAVIPTTPIYTSFDFDYYFVFGKSSIENIQAQKIRIGNTKVICAGSSMIDKDFQLVPADPANRTLLYFSNWMVGENSDYTRDFEIVKEWACNNPGYKLLIKIHPLEKNGYVQNAVKGLGNVRILDSSITMKEAVSLASATIVAFSVASLESALLNRPVVVANFRPFDPNSEDIRISDNFLHLENYFPERARDAAELTIRVNELFSRYDYYLAQCGNFVKQHMEYGTESREHLVSIIENMFLEKEPGNFTEIKETLDVLK